MRLDPAQQAAWVRGRGKVWRLRKLSPVEFRLLRVLAEHAGTVLDRGFLLAQAWGRKETQVYPGTVDKYIQMLRRKLGKARIRTRYGLGYSFCCRLGVRSKN